MQEKLRNQSKVERAIHQEPAESAKVPAPGTDEDERQPPAAAGPRAAPAEHSRRSKVTPIDFRTLLPAGGAEPGMSGKRDATKKFYSIVYPCQLDEHLAFLL